jgi:hypothetical protein
MAKKILAEILVLIFPIIVFVVHKRYPANPITPYFIPKNLTGQKYPKSQLRQVGVGYCILALWLFSLIVVTTAYFLPFIEQVPALMAALYFILPIVTVMSLIIGASYLLRGIFGRGDMAKPPLESINDAQREDLPKYIHKIKIYNVVNLSCPVLLAILIPIEVMLGVAERGPAILINVSLLITFIMTLWKIRIYLAKAAKVMDLPANKILLSTLSNPLAVFFVWVHSIMVIKKFNQQKQASEHMSKSN